jgi:hypothetical protein
MAIQAMDYEKIIRDYRIGRDSRVVFKDDPRVYYIKNITADRKGAFVTITGSENIYKRLSNLVKVNGKEIIKESMCDCGCNTCDTPKAPLLNESLVKRQALSEGLNYHVSKAIPLTENVYRAGSEKYFQLWKEARDLYVRDLLEVQGDDLDIILETDLGYTGIYEGKEVHLDFIFEEQVKEAEYQGKDVELGKPKRGGSKKFYVYVKDPKTKKVKKVSFGAKDGGQNLAVKIRDPKARKLFADRHNCSQKNDKTKPGYWACRVGRYWKALGGDRNYPGFW